PARIGGEAHFAFRLEARCGFQKTDMPFLYEVPHRKAEMAEFGGHRDDETHMCDGHAVKSVLVVLFLPAHCQIVLLVALEIRCAHRCPGKCAVDGFGGHASLVFDWL